MQCVFATAGNRNMQMVICMSRLKDGLAPHPDGISREWLSELVDRGTAFPNCFECGIRSVSSQTSIRKPKKFVPIFIN